MTGKDIALRRLRNQRLAGDPFESPPEAVGCLGAVQSQDYGGAKWALAQRTPGATDSDLDRLFDEGAILRTHLMRPTWHFVEPAPAREGGPAVHLLPNYDEFLVAYQDRSASFDSSRGLDMSGFRSGILDNVVVLRGQVWGGWKRRLEGRQAVLELGPLDVLDPGEAAELEQAAGRLGRFLGLPVTTRLPSA